MLKFVVIGVLIAAFLSFVLWNFWKMVLLKHKYFSESETFLFFLGQFKEAPAKLKSIKTDKIKLWIVAVIGSLLTVLIVLTYFLIARNVFLNNHTHSYKDRVTVKPTCVAEGVTEYKCRYCDEKYEEAIAIIAHKHVQSSYLDSTCTQEGKIEYTCEMCADIKAEAIALKEHEYIQNVEQEASCSAEGVLAKQCKNCDFVEKESIPTNDVHNYTVLSFTESSFWRNGYHHYSCKDCSAEAYSLNAKACNWVAALAILLLVTAFITIFGVRADEGFWRYTFERPLFWFALVCTIPSIILMILHWGFVLPHQKANEPVFPSLTHAPVECELVEQERVESSFIQNGTVLYKCQNCNKEYTEYLPLKEIVIDQIPVYTEPAIAQRNESEKNGKITTANELPMYTRMTGQLASQKDVDVYKVTLLTDGNIKFKFTHDADPYSNHWNATIYDDKSTVLNEGYIDKEEFGCSDLPAGTYYLKISVISGGNPIMNTYSNADYHLVFAPECTAHTETTQYFSKIPVCSEPVEITTVCNHCGTVVSVEAQKELEHSWGEWEITNSSETETSGEKVRTCTLCNETQTEKDSAGWWENLWN